MIEISEIIILFNYYRYVYIYFVKFYKLFLRLHFIIIFIHLIKR